MGENVIFINKNMEFIEIKRSKKNRKKEIVT